MLRLKSEVSMLVLRFLFTMESIPHWRRVYVRTQQDADL